MRLALPPLLLGLLLALASQEPGTSACADEKVRLESWYSRGAAFGSFNGEGYRAFVEVGPGDDLEKIARRFAGTRDWRPLKRLLEQQLKASAPSPGGKVKIPLEKLLPRFIRRTAQTLLPKGVYSPSGGPNCADCALQVLKPTATRPGGFLPFNAFERQALSTLRLVKPGEALQPEDVLWYLDRNRDPVHAMTYVGNVDGLDLVFTKNGASPAQPYMFADKARIESGYFSDGEYLLVVLRKPQAGESPVSRNGELPGGRWDLTLYEDRTRKPAKPGATAGGCGGQMRNALYRGLSGSPW